MKKFLLSLLAISSLVAASAQNVGIGTHTPTQKLEVNGAIKVSASSGNHVAAGTIQWNPDKNDFEGFNGVNWVSLTGGKGSWGNQFSYATENSVSNLRLFTYYDNNDFPFTGRYLGNALAISGDWLAAGAPGDVHPGIKTGLAGSVRLFKKDGTGFTYIAPVQSPNPGNSFHFGHSVSIDGHFLIAGSPGAYSYAGRAYIYALDANGVATLQANLLAPDGTAQDYFGQAVALSGNLAAVSAHVKTVNGNVFAGKVYCYRRDVASNIWLPLPAIISPDIAAHARFGETLSMSGNYMAIGAPQTTVNGNEYNRGKVYIYQLNGNAWTLTDSFTSPAHIGRELFGSSLYMKGDTLLVGAIQQIYEPDNGNGRVYVYVRNGNDWVYQATLTASDGKKNDAFGASVHLHNGTIVVGAPYAKVASVADAGKAYVFKNMGSSWVQQAILAASDPVATFGGPVLGKAVVIKDNTIVASAPNMPVGSYEANGKLYFFNK